jgi:hypothetical protein
MAPLLWCHFIAQGVVFFIYSIKYLRMPRAVRVKTELLNLKEVGGHGILLHHVIAPPCDLSLQLNLHGSSSLLDCTKDADSDSDDDSDSSSGSEISAFMLPEDSSCCSDDDMEVDHMDILGRGNRLADFPALTSAVKRLASCKYCYADQIENEFELFMMYCDRTRNEVVEEGHQIFLSEEANRLRDHLYDKKWYNE